MKPKDYLAIIEFLTADPEGFVPLPIFRKVIRTTPRTTAREEAVLAEVIKKANPRQNITAGYGLGPEQQLVYQQLWAKGNTNPCVKRWWDIPVKGAEKLYTFQEGIPVPNTIAEPGAERMDLGEKLRELTDVPMCPICKIAADLCDCQEQGPDDQ